MGEKSLYLQIRQISDRNTTAFSPEYRHKIIHKTVI